MIREKQFEVLRGMKFMQRKEEAMRRERMMEQQQLSALQHNAPATSSSAEEAPRSTIIIDNKFNLSLHVSGRKRFVHSPYNGDTMDLLSTQQQSAPVAILIDGDEGNPWDVTSPLDIDGAQAAIGSSHVFMNSTIDTDRDNNQLQSGSRFTVDSSVRAPPMPRRLRDEMEPRKKRSRQESINYYHQSCGIKSRQIGKGRVVNSKSDDDSEQEERF